MWKSNSNMHFDSKQLVTYAKYVQNTHIYIFFSRIDDRKGQNIDKVNRVHKQVK